MYGQIESPVSLRDVLEHSSRQLTKSATLRSIEHGASLKDHNRFPLPISLGDMRYVNNLVMMVVGRSVRDQTADLMFFQTKETRLNPDLVLSLEDVLQQDAVVRILQTGEIFCEGVQAHGEIRLCAILPTDIRVCSPQRLDKITNAASRSFS